MKELIGVARNIFLAYQDDEKAFLPTVEMVLMVSEQGYIMDDAGAVAENRQVETIRVCANPAAVAMLMKNCVEWLELMERFEKERKGEA